MADAGVGGDGIPPKQEEKHEGPAGGGQRGAQCEGGEHTRDEVGEVLRSEERNVQGVGGGDPERVERALGEGEAVVVAEPVAGANRIGEDEEEPVVVGRARECDEGLGGDEP